jgi:hypothetical protein
MIALGVVLLHIGLDAGRKGSADAAPHSPAGLLLNGGVLLIRECGPLGILKRLGKRLVLALFGLFPEIMGVTIQ